MEYADLSLAPLSLTLFNIFLIYIVGVPSVTLSRLLMFHNISYLGYRGGIIFIYTSSITFSGGEKTNDWLQVETMLNNVIQEILFSDARI